MGEAAMARTVLITGASTGIGAATARLLGPGNTVFVHYNRSERQAYEVTSDIEKAGGQAILVQADVGTEAGCTQIVSSVRQEVDSLDVLVNNAGGLIERGALADGLRWELLEAVFRINTFSAMFLTSHLVPLLRQGQDPCVVNISSIAQRHGNPSATPYGACKAALDSFTRGAAKELAPDIRVNAVAPGVIETPFHERYSTPERMKVFAENTPLKRNGQDHHIAMAVRFLVENDFITGETVDVNGGLFMR